MHLKINAGLALPKSFRSPVLSLRGLSEVIFFLIHGGNYLGLVIAAMKLKDAYSLEGKL